jgi:hypothetical protein
MSETRWVCDGCGSVADNEDAECSCDHDVSDLIAEIKALRVRQRTVLVTAVTAATPRMVRPQRGSAAGQDFLIVTGKDQNGTEVTVKLAIGCFPTVWDPEYVDTAIEDTP